MDVYTHAYTNIGMHIYFIYTFPYIIAINTVHRYLHIHNKTAHHSCPHLHVETCAHACACTQAQQCCTLPGHTAFPGSIVAEQSCKGAEAQTPRSASPENPQPLGVWEGEPDALPAGGTVESMTQVDFCNKSKGEGFFHPVASNP